MSISDRFLYVLFIGFPTLLKWFFQEVTNDNHQEMIFFRINKFLTLCNLLMVYGYKVSFNPIWGEGLVWKRNILLQDTTNMRIQHNFNWKVIAFLKSPNLHHYISGSFEHHEQNIFLSWEFWSIALCSTLCSPVLNHGFNIYYFLGKG